MHEKYGSDKGSRHHHEVFSLYQAYLLTQVIYQLFSRFLVLAISAHCYTILLCMTVYVVLD